MELVPDSTTNDGYIWRCPIRRCRKKITIRKRSMFENSNIALKTAVSIMYFWCIDMPVRISTRELGMTRNTCLYWYRCFRDIACFHFENLGEEEKIGGVGKIVEIDESLFAKRKYHKGRKVEQVWMFGGIERTDGEIKFFVEIVPDRSEATLLEIINRRIEKFTWIMSDRWKSYCHLDEHGYLHDTVNHSQHFINPIIPVIHTQTIESRWSAMKRFLRRKGTNLSNNLSEYLVEYLYRKKFGDDIYEQLLKDVRKKYKFGCYLLFYY